MRRAVPMLLLVALAGCEPRVEVADLDGRNGKNNAFRVVVDRAAPFRAAVLAQELWEAEQKQDPVQAVEIRLSDGERRAFEIMGHEVEVQGASLIYGEDAAAYRAKEAASMQRGYDGLFRQMSAAQIVQAMEQQASKASRWVEHNRGTLEAYR